ncbi:hypothetical protein [Pelagicoccus sp. SDUM812003]|uniref:hypothetical protein n=1 Tax=Pelagicoccus sp. SDUM812003 TaxID=3041267 RepID=UPI00280E5265|nr:hypothetical protein [Pelagicoccus sp. SDUM812003]MDQ8204199.1 hypothetical protein [Pelagicoccus sp. SDUM812003]
MMLRATLLMALLALPLRAISQESSVFSELKVTSLYQDRGFQLGDFTLHPSIEWAASDWYAGFFAALPLENRSAPDRFENEYDFYLGKGWAAGDRVFWDAGATFYAYEDSDSSFETYLGVNAELGTFSPSLYAYYDFDLEAFTLELSSGVALPLDGFPGEVKLYLGRIETRDQIDYTYYGVDLIYPIEVGDQMRLELGVHYADNDIGLGIPDEHLYGSVSLSYGF